jgi:hypothetical protein
MLGLRRGTVFLSKVMVISEGGLDYKAVRISVRRLLLTRASVVLRTPAPWGLAHVLAVRPWHTGRPFCS